ncbi:unnamed protein product [Hyaloperonospora brassicae]|uniref:RWP-RK domain-containing protein n=1 Tax=Hyaloperonospora brassicae TaxID=162125 RepID=A0AAV0UMH9_HYABA|nr:unnamed protein product [Hyaloperonospora brassicae]
MSLVPKHELTDAARPCVKRRKLTASASCSSGSPEVPSPCTAASSSRPNNTSVSSSITLDTLRPHFEEPLATVAATFGICVTLLKKICRRQGIARWPHRQITGLRKSIVSMEHAIYYFDGTRRAWYVEQLTRQKTKLAALLADPTTTNAVRVTAKDDGSRDKPDRARPTIALVAPSATATAATTAHASGRTFARKGRAPSTPTGPLVEASPCYGTASMATQAPSVWLPPIESNSTGLWTNKAYYSPSMVDHFQCDVSRPTTSSSYYNHMVDSTTSPGRLPPIQLEPRGMLPPISSLVGRPRDCHTFTM